MLKKKNSSTSEFEIPCSTFCGSAKRILLIGYGNPGRLDDGLGPALAEKFQQAEPAPNSFQPLEKLDPNPPRPPAFAELRRGRSATPPKEGSSQDVGLNSPPVEGCRNGGVGALWLENLTVEANYQLNVEDAAQIAEHDVVIFADASTDAEPPFTFTSVEAEKGGPTFSSHSISAPQLLGMTEELFGKKPEAWMLAIRGYDFNEFGEKLSEQATQNLEAATEFLKDHFSKHWKN